jgi:hypothetical protein
MTETDFRHFQQAFRDAGFEINETWYDEEVFRSWFIDLTKEGLPKQRVTWDGKDRWLIVSVLASTGSWMDKWVGRTAEEQTLRSALSQLKLPVTRKWEQQVEAKSEEYWRQYKLRQVRKQSRRLWDECRYSDFVQELEPYRNDLSPAELKRLEIARKRA